MQTVHVQIDIATPTGRRLLKEVERHPRVAKIEYSIPTEMVVEKTYTLEESYDECCDILNENYKCDVRKL